MVQMKDGVAPSHAHAHAMNQPASAHVSQPAASPGVSALGPVSWPELAVLLCSGPCMAIMFVAIAPVLPALASRFTSLDGALLAQMVMTLPGIGIIVGGPAGGWWAERVGAARVARSSLAVYALAGSAGLFADHVALLMASRFILGMAAGGIASSTTAMISERFDGAGRARMLGYQTSIASATAVLAILGSGAVAEMGGWRAPFVLYPLLALPLFLLALRALPSVAPQQATQAAQPSLPGAIWGLLTVVALLFAAAFMTGAQTAFLLVEDGVQSPWLMSLIIGSASLGNALGAASFGPCMSRLGSRGSIALSLSLMALGLAVLGLTHVPPWAGAGCLLAGLGSGLVGPWIATLLLDRTPAALRPRVSGLLYAAIFIGDFLNPLLVLPLKKVVGLHGAFVAVAAVLACTAAVLALRRR